MKLSIALMIGALCAGAIARAACPRARVVDDESALLQADRAAFSPSSITLNNNSLEPDAVWTDSSGNTRNKSEIEQALQAKQLSNDAAIRPGAAATTAHVYGPLGVVQENAGKGYVLRIWIKRDAGWRLLIYQAVAIGAAPSATPGTAACENPCNTVPFEPQSAAEGEVIRAYQAVERAVTAHDSAAWGSHMAGEFFAVTSNSDRPLDKAARMAGLDKQKEAGIAPFPLVSARMFEFGDAMVMVSRQQPQGGLPLHVTRVWFKRNGAWLEAYSYQTTIQPGTAAR